MMNLKTGMYVRSCEYGIGKVEICECSMCQERGYTEPRIIFKNHIEYITDKKTEELYAKSAKHDPIDLIGIGDYVNGYKVVQIGKSIENRKFITTEAYHKINYGNVFKDEIESIVTKEQFERESYKVGE